MNCITPRHFDEAQQVSNQEIDANLSFEFIFDRNLSSTAEKLLFKDVASS
jgi:hypothetical protein